MARLISWILDETAYSHSYSYSCKSLGTRLILGMYRLMCEQRCLLCGRESTSSSSVCFSYEMQRSSISWHSFNCDVCLYESIQNVCGCVHVCRCAFVCTCVYVCVTAEGVKPWNIHSICVYTIVGTSQTPNTLFLSSLSLPSLPHSSPFAFLFLLLESSCVCR